MKYPIITIEREYGSGGVLIGQRVAQELGVPFYNHEILEMAAQRLGVPISKLEGAEETSPKSFLYSLLINSNPNRSLDDNIPIADKLYVTETEIIKELAAQGPCVIVGRCANYTLRNHPHHCSVFVYAPKAYRMQFAMQEYKVPEREIETLLPRVDSRREKFYNINTGGNWHDKDNYTLCLNSSRFGVEGCVRMILSTVETLPDVED
ncbi:MAG: cytidylate kinase-like family protein [Ruminococcus sp.]|nr:cytidylate kinase-like family protein [Ruminococcus sp.]